VEHCIHLNAVGSRVPRQFFERGGQVGWQTTHLETLELSWVTASHNLCGADHRLHAPRHRYQHRTPHLDHSFIPRSTAGVPTGREYLPEGGLLLCCRRLDDKSLDRPVTYPIKAPRTIACSANKDVLVGTTRAGIMSLLLRVSVDCLLWAPIDRIIAYETFIIDVEVRNRRHLP